MGRCCKPICCIQSLRKLREYLRMLGRTKLPSLHSFFYYDLIEERERTPPARHMIWQYCTAKLYNETAEAFCAQYPVEIPRLLTSKIVDRVACVELGGTCV
jgi:hypothetical protein